MSSNVQKLPARRSRAVLTGASEASAGGNFIVSGCGVPFSASYHLKPIPQISAFNVHHLRFDFADEGQVVAGF